MKAPFELRNERRIIIDETLATQTGKRPTWTQYFDHAYVVSCFRGRYEFHDVWDEFTTRHIKIEISTRTGFCAVALFREWRGSVTSDASTFVDEADAHSQSSYSFARAVYDSWDEYDFPARFGTIVQFSRLAIRSRADDTIMVWDCIRHSIAREFHRRCALILLKAFPLEFEGACCGLESCPRFRMRRNAMLRHYRNKLNARLLPNGRGSDGWMWMPILFSCEPASKKLSS